MWDKNNLEIEVLFVIPLGLHDSDLKNLHFDL